MTRGWRVLERSATLSGMSRFPFFLVAFLLGCSSTSEAFRGPDANEVRREVSAARPGAFQAMKSALFAKGYILLPPDEASGVVRTEWTGVRENIGLSVMRFIFTPRRPPGYDHRHHLSRRRPVRLCHECPRAPQGATFWKQRWSILSLPRSDELACSEKSSTRRRDGPRRRAVAFPRRTSPLKRTEGSRPSIPASSFRSTFTRLRRRAYHRS